jgi:hypothetical protein
VGLTRWGMDASNSPAMAIWISHNHRRSLVLTHHDVILDTTRGNPSGDEERRENTLEWGGLVLFLLCSHSHTTMSFWTHASARGNPSGDEERRENTLEWGGLVVFLLCSHACSAAALLEK